MGEENPDWFANVENIKPVRGGRAAGSLASLARSAKKVSSKEAEDKFREEFGKAQTSDDPLGILNGYLQWFQQTFPSGKPSLLYPILYKMVTTYSNDQRFQHDERLLKLWMELAESFPERGLAVMDFAYTRGSLREMAKFYVRWSEMYDNLKNARRARETLELGITNRAMPLNILHDAKDRLEARLLRDIVIQNMDDSDYEEIDMDYSDDDHEPEYFNTRERLPIGRLRGLGDVGEAPMIRRALATPVGRVGRIQGLPQSTPQASFKIFEDKVPMKTPKVVPSSSKGNRIADEFEDDPDYRALFGFFDHRPKTQLDLHTSENSRRPIQWTQCAVKELCEIPAAEPEFEIYTDEPVQPQPTPKARPKLASAPQKAKMKLRKEWALEMSIEEGYAMMIETNKIHASGDGIM